MTSRASSANTLLLVAALVVATLVPFAVADTDDDSCTVPGPAAIVPAPDGSRLSALAAEALRRISARSPDEVPAAPGSGSGHGTNGSAPVPLTPDEQRVFDGQLACARKAAAALATPEQAIEAGYVQGSTFTQGVGEHWIDWTAVGRPFDPGRPSMLLFAERRFGRPAELVGFSYWVGSPTEPAGFAGPNDHWHRHEALCFENGWLMRQSVVRKADCSDAFVAGTDLWMLHAWVVEGVPSRLGMFSTINPALCLGNRATTPDILRCDPDKL